MRQSDQYIIQSLELHLFFDRIMKEHAFFLKAGLTPPDSAFARETEFYRKEFEKLLCRVVPLSDRSVTHRVLRSGELFTEYTLRAESQSERFTGIPINRNLTLREKRLNPLHEKRFSREKVRAICDLNQSAIRLVRGLISLKERILNQVLRCRTFTANYPLLIEHIIREAKLYEELLLCLESEGMIHPYSMRKSEEFWNRIMMEHAMFIRGLLDPSEQKLINSADAFAKDYSRLLKKCCSSQDPAFLCDGKEALSETLKFRDFKIAGVCGITGCKIRSVILPLLADHVLREANHYIRILCS